MKNDQTQNKSGLYAVIILSAVVLGLIVFAGLSLFGARSSGSTNTNSTIRMNTLTISASGTVTNATTMSTVYVQINGTGKTNQLAVQNVSNTLAIFNSTISKFINGNLSEISTNYFNTYKIYNQSAYEATESLSVNIQSIKNVSVVIGALSGIPNIYVTSATSQLSSSQVSIMRTQALSLALANATSQAEALVGHNNTIYTTNISVNNYYVYPFQYAIGAASSSGPSTGITTTVPPQIYGGTGTVTESITVVFGWGPKQ